MAAWFNGSTGASELMDAIQDLVLLGRAWDEPNDSDIYFVKWNEQIKAVRTLLDSWPARYVPQPDWNTFYLVLEPYQKKYATESQRLNTFKDWNRLGDLAVISAAKMVDWLRRCGRERQVLYNWQIGMPQCNRWFFAERSSQVFCSQECKDNYWNEVKKHEMKKPKPLRSPEKRKAWNEQRRKNRNFTLREGRKP